MDRTILERIENLESHRPPKNVKLVWYTFTPNLSIEEFAEKQQEAHPDKKIIVAS